MNRLLALPLLAVVLLAVPAGAELPFLASPNRCDSSGLPLGCIPLPNEMSGAAGTCNGEKWKYASTNVCTTDPVVLSSSNELNGVSGMSVEIAWRKETGRPDVVIAVHDSGPRERRQRRLCHRHIAKRRVDGLQDVIAQLQSRRGRIRVHLLGARGTHDRRSYLVAPRHPRQRHLRQAQPGSLGDRAQPGDGLEHRLLHQGTHEAAHAVARRARTGGRRLAGSILAGEHSLGER